MAAKSKPRKRVYCDARHYVAKAEAAFAKCDDVAGGWHLLEGLWRFLFSECVYWRCVPHEVPYSSAGRDGRRCLKSMLREQAAMRRELVRCGCLKPASYSRFFAVLAQTGGACASGTLQDERCILGAVSFLAATLDAQNGPGGDIRQPRATHKGGWTIRDARDARNAVRKPSRGRAVAARKLVQPKGGGRA